MEAEIREIREHLSQFPPFDGLSEALLDEVAVSVEIAYFKADSTILEQGQPIHSLPYIRKLISQLSVLIETSTSVQEATRLMIDRAVSAAPGSGRKKSERQARYRSLFESCIEGKLISDIRQSVNRGLAFRSERSVRAIEKFGGEGRDC